MPEAEDEVEDVALGGPEHAGLEEAAQEEAEEEDIEIREKELKNVIDEVDATVKTLIVRAHVSKIY